MHYTGRNDKLSPKDTHVNMRKHGLFLLKDTKTHFNATFTHVSAAFKDIISSSVTAVICAVILECGGMVVEHSS